MAEETTFRFDKLVRDWIPANMERRGAKPVYRKLTPEEHERELMKKAAEELAELADAEGDDKLTRLGDLREVLDALTRVLGHTPEAVRLAQNEKHDKSGGFLAGLYVETLTISDDDPWFEVFASQPERYPRVAPE